MTVHDQVDTGDGTALAPKYREGPAEINGDVHLHQRYFTYRTSEGLVAGKTMNVMFTIDRPAREVWPYVKDFNLWQNSYDHYYSGVIGDLEGSTFRLSLRRGEADEYSEDFEVLRVVPEQLILARHLLADGSSPEAMRGFQTVLLSEHGGKTVLTFLFEHSLQSQGQTEEEALQQWYEAAPDSHMKWKEIFIPNLKALIYGE